MKHLFIPYENGFNEPCLAFYNLFSGKIPFKYSGTNPSTCPDEYVPAPLYQQIIDWFREKHL